MDDRTKTDGDQILYLNEVHDEASKPLTSNNTEAVPSVFPRAGFTETDDLANNPRNPSLRPSISRTEMEGFNGNDRPVIGFDGRNGPELLTPDVNVYQHKKTLAQGMMDLALLSANANQMRYVLQTDGRHPYFYPSLTMISMSLFLQIAVGIGLIWNSVYNVKEHEQMCKANKANNWTVIGIFLVTILNVFISSFGVVDQATVVVT
ncbi:ninjurin-1-like isoform x1 protein [Lasius niger]|uniref:Ninjurin-1-like isoform x1 protein n=1 Tax=Lasius niger TaxID=67767 RepID=A0A0J7KM51_LASNI|nr:ninjurin-1-like isoform x1 protein [Lasius niger]